MTAQPRIRPRVWPSGAQRRVPWYWPVSLIFRKVLSRYQPAAIAPRVWGSPSGTRSYFTHHHYHTQQATRLVSQYVAANTFLLAQPALAAPPGVGALRHLHVPRKLTNIRERSVETRHLFSGTHELRRAFRATHRVDWLERNAKAGNTAPAAGSAGDLKPAPVLRQSIRSEMREPRVYSANTALRTWLAAPPAAIGRWHEDKPAIHRQASRWRPAGEGAPPLPRPASTAPSPVHQVWRRNPPSLREARGETPSPASNPGRVSENAPSRAFPEPSRSRIDSAPAQAAFRLEGPAMDRLAEDVMKRIERHLRIERERRGI
ncbi:MAG TPA: hypothetical protein VKT49_11015 [Bryobacteraceae bacterium]|nr:hypothetical protein [Bryobacteraceae bacterium]